MGQDVYFFNSYIRIDYKVTFEKKNDLLIKLNEEKKYDFVFVLLKNLCSAHDETDFVLYKQKDDVQFD